MKIAFSGVQCTGKTTLINEMKNDSMFDNYEFCLESIRKLQKEGFKINEDGDDNTQIAVMLSHIYNMNLENSILDRCLLDGICYTEYAYKHKQITKKTYDVCLKLFELGVKEYDIIFYIRPEFDMIEDGTRSTNKIFRDEVLQIFEQFIKQYNLENVTVLSGSVEERLKQIKNKVVNFE